MHVYAESSAVLAWLLDQRHGPLVAAALEHATVVVASDVTLIECDRVLIRAVAQKTLAERELVLRQSRLNAVSAHWTLLALDEEIIERARRPFPVEPVRTLDALHLASMMTARKAPIPSTTNCGTPSVMVLAFASLPETRIIFTVSLPAPVCPLRK